MSTPLPPSPCIRNCCLDNEVCLGCHRHIDEIVGWGSADAATREAILKRAQARAELRAQHSQSQGEASATHSTTNSATNSPT